MGKFRPEQFDEDNYENLETEKVEVEFTEEEFAELLSGDKFLECLKVAGKETKKSGYETGFEVYFDEQKNIEFGHVLKGSLDEIDEYEGDTEILKRGIKRPKIEEKDTGAIGFHFHPSCTEPLCPSGADLNLLHEHEVAGVVESLTGVCSIDSKDNIDILLIKIKKGVHSSEVEDNAQFFEEAIGREYGNILFYKRDSEIDNVVQQHLDQTGFYSCIISLQYDRKSKKYFLTEESKEKLKKIGGLKFKLQKTK